jgi:hypothetical protein
VLVLFPGVAAFVGFAQVGDVEPGVVVERLEALVSQELLDVVEVLITNPLIWYLDRIKDRRDKVADYQSN